MPPSSPSVAATVTNKTRAVVMGLALLTIFVILILWRPRAPERALVGWHLPEAPDRGRGRRVLVLDLDETLVHALPPDHRTVLVRPHAAEFLAAVSRTFDEVVVFTAGTREYASPVLDGLDPDGTLLGRRFYRDSCSVMPGTGLLVKDLRILGEADLSRVRIVDNTPSAYALQPQCAVPIRSYEGDDPDDTELLRVLRKLFDFLENTPR